MAGAEQPFDDRDGKIWFDGELVDWRDAKVHILTHALHYASSVFEGARAYSGTVFKLREHNERLIASAEMLGMTMTQSVEELDEAVIQTLKANNLTDAYVRPLVWRGAEQMGVAAERATIHHSVAVWSWPSYFSPEAREKGLRLMIADWKRPSPETIPTKAKAAGLYMICTLTKHKATAEGYDDALMMDWRGRVAECTGANIFFRQGDVLHTPTPDCFLDGITRRTAMELARARGIEVVERTIMPEEMADFEECFITGTAAEITPIGEIGPYKFTVGEITRNLMQDYDDLVNGRS
ncbi:MAG: branched-chain amino acid aminotransferase [Proteobacteria bacterium]|nr:branched-chain amino acid aminotransferase [Pseudomonadota bacterium]